MKLDFKGVKNANYQLQELETYLDNVDSKSCFVHNGLVVEIDPTIDLSNSNILVRWTDVNEGFNDKIILYSFEEFNQNFKPYN